MEEEILTEVLQLLILVVVEVVVRLLQALLQTVVMEVQESLFYLFQRQTIQQHIQVLQPLQHQAQTLFLNILLQGHIQDESLR